MSKINIELADGTKAGETLKQLTYQAAKLKNELSLLAPGTEEFVKKAESLNQVKGRLGDIRDQINNTTKASDALKNAWNQLPGAQYFNQISSSFSSMKSGVGGLISQFGLLKTAIAATGIGLLVLAVSSLILAFSKFTPLVDKVEQVMNGLGQIIEVVVNRLINVGKGLIDIATGNWSSGIDRISNSFDNMGEAMKGAYDAGVRLKKLQQDLEDAARGLDIANARAEATVNRLIVQSKNKAITDQESINILQKARQIAEEDYKANDIQKAKEFALLIDEAKLISQLSEEEILQLTEGTLAAEIEYEKRGTISDDLLDRIKNAQIERINAEGATSKLLEKIQNAEDARLQKQTAAQEKAIADKKKRDEEAAAELLKNKQAENDALQNIEDLRIQKLAEGEEKDIAKIQIDTQRKIEALTGSAQLKLEQTALLEEIENQQIQGIRDKYAKIKQDKEQKQNEEKLAKDKEQAAKEAAIARQKAEFQSNLADFNVETTRQATSTIGDLIAQNVKDEQKAKAIKKTFAVVDIGIRLSQELSANALAAAANPLNAVTFGAAGAAQLTASNTRSFIMAALNTAKVLAFRKGGWTGNGDSDDPAGIVHKNEYVVPAEITQDPRFTNVLSLLENARLGGYKNGGMVSPTNPYSDKSRTSISRTASSDQPIVTFDYDRLSDLIDQKMDKKIMTLRVVQNLQEVKGGLNVLQQLKDEADV